MTVTAASAFSLALATSNVLLLVTAVFSQFPVFTGWRALHQRRLHEGGLGARWFDWLVSALALAFSAGLLVTGWTTGRNMTEMFFGTGGGVLASRDGPADGAGRAARGLLVRHMIGLSGAFIATASAFAVVTRPSCRVRSPLSA